MATKSKMSNPLTHKPRVVVHYIPAGHLNQIYDGFGRLAKAGLVDLSIVNETGNPLKGWTYVDIDDKRVVYDCMDGLIWLDDTEEANLQYLQTEINCDFYFKRSYTPDLLDYLPDGCKMFPLGLNYSYCPYGPWGGIRNRIKVCLLQNRLVECFHGKKIFKLSDFEYPPIMHQRHQILFLARLWDPLELNDSANAEWIRTLNQLNAFRMECVERLRKEFGENFIGGIERSAYSVQHCPKELLVPSYMTNRNNFLLLVKESDICIATTGLHNSIGWKLAEYVAASRAIISEPLCYQLPGNFVDGHNYLSASSVDSVIERVHMLVEDECLLQKMQLANHSYYENYVRSNQMVLNTLKIIEESNK